MQNQHKNRFLVLLYVLSCLLKQEMHCTSFFLKNVETSEIKMNVPYKDGALCFEILFINKTSVLCSDATTRKI